MKTHAWPSPVLWPFAPPSIDWDFAARKVLDSRVTFTRASSATYVDAAGLVQTAGVNVPRFDHDPVTLASRGLLIEESRSNLLLNSAALATQSVAVSAVAYTLSFAGTGTVTLSGASAAGPLVGTGANRVSLTFTPAAGSLTLTVAGAVNNAQLEVGAFATSYIPTAGAAATRAADLATVSGAGFSAWYRPDQGTLLAEAFPSSIFNGPTFAAFVNSIVTEYSALLRYLHPNLQGLTRVAGVSYILQAAAAPVGASQIQRVALSYGAAGVSFAGNGVSVGAGNPFPASGVALAYLGRFGSGAFLNGALSRLRYWPRRLPDSVLQRLTA